LGTSKGAPKGEGGIAGVLKSFEDREREEGKGKARSGKK
jgi:hypothetical protein